MNRSVKLLIGLLCTNLIIILVLYCTQAPQIDPPKSITASTWPKVKLRDPPIKLQVEVWSKAAIGQYFWEDILAGETRKQDKFYLEGNFTSTQADILFRSGASLTVDSLKAFTQIQNLVLILNWRTKEKINSTLPWLETAVHKPDIQNLGIVALGNEQCHNSWFEHWLENNPNAYRKFRFLFIVYDWSKVDNIRYYQWPLGVATYRNFPPPAENTTSLITSPRPFVCNFIGTIYPGSSRQELQELFNQEESAHLRRSCIVRTRSKWVGDESQESMRFYVNALKASELTLNPLGMNHECYRIYEAAAYGSIPVIEHNLKHVAQSSCDRTNTYRLFRDLQAPFIYVSNWTLEISDVIRRQSQKSAWQKEEERKHLMEWYAKFKTILRDRFLNVLTNKFSNE